MRISPQCDELSIYYENCSTSIFEKFQSKKDRLYLYFLGFLFTLIKFFYRIGTFVSLRCTCSNHHKRFPCIFSSMQITPILAYISLFLTLSLLLFLTLSLLVLPHIKASNVSKHPLSLLFLCRPEKGVRGSGWYAFAISTVSS